MEINRLRHFCTVVETGHVRAAAELLNISPGALSKSLSVFRGELGKDIFILAGRKLRLTDYGKKIYAHALNILRDLNTMSSLAEHENELFKPVRIATFEVFSTHFLAGYISDQKNVFSVTCFELAPGKIEEAVDSRLVDFGITYIPSPRETLEHIPVAKFRFGVFGNKKWAGKSLAELPFAIPTTHVPALSSHIKGMDSWPISIIRKVAFEFEMLETALLLSAKGKSVLHCPEFVVRRFNEIILPANRLEKLSHLEKVIKPIDQTVYIVKSRDQAESHLMKQIAQQLRADIVL